MKVVNVHEAKTRLSQLLVASELGEDVVIARQGVPVVKLVALAPSARPEAGAWASKPGWADYRFDPAVLSPMLTDDDLNAEGWPV